jgi:hypothetical protein
MDRQDFDRPVCGPDWIRLGFHVVVTAPGEGACQQRCQALLQDLLALFWPVGELYDFVSSPYPKVPDAMLLRVAFDLPAPYEAGIAGILHTVGGSGWHIDPESDGEEGAVWLAADDAVRPFGDHFHWAEVRLIPSAHLEAFRKHAGPRLCQ